jgi:hypothetical protein
VNHINRARRRANEDHPNEAATLPSGDNLELSRANFTRISATGGANNPLGFIRRATMFLNVFIVPLIPAETIFHMF